MRMLENRKVYKGRPFEVFQKRSCNPDKVVDVICSRYGLSMSTKGEGDTPNSEKGGYLKKASFVSIHTTTGLLKCILSNRRTPKGAIVVVVPLFFLPKEGCTAPRGFWETELAFLPETTFVPFEGEMLSDAVKAIAEAFGLRAAMEAENDFKAIGRTFKNYMLPVEEGTFVFSFKVLGNEVERNVAGVRTKVHAIELSEAFLMSKEGM